MKLLNGVMFGAGLGLITVSLGGGADTHTTLAAGLGIILVMTAAGWVLCNRSLLK